MSGIREKELINNNDLISVIMPAYNCEKFVSDAINSVLTQSYKDFELIVIDDCSKDNTFIIAKKFADIDSRIMLLRNEENLGVSATRNKGIALSKGNWIAFLDSDDLWTSNKLDKQIHFARNYNVDFIFTGSSFIDENNNEYRGIFHIPNRVSFKKLLKQNVISCSSVLINKRYFNDIKMERDDIHEDFGTWLRILKKTSFAYGIDEPLLIYRISRGSRSGNKFKSMKMTYSTYRFVGLNLLATIYNLLWYSLNGIVKYKRIKIKRII